MTGEEDEKLRAECTLAGVQLTPKGRVVLSQRPHPLHYHQLSDTHLEKMWIYSLGVTVRGVVSWTEASPGLRTILSRMLSPDLHSRASLMDLLDVISAYCRGRKHTKPLSHVVMDMYSQTVGHTNIDTKTSPRVSNGPSANGSVLSTPKSEKTISPQVKPNQDNDVTTTFYSKPINGTKYCGPNTFIGPEFIIRASDPTGLVHIGDIKAASKRKVLVVLLNGQILEITCDPSKTTFADIFQIVTSREGLDHSVTLGLACLVSDDFVFPPAEFKLSKVAPVNWSKSRSQPPPFVVYLRFRLYLPSLRGSRSWKWKHLLYLQLRKSLLDRHLRAEKQQLLTLAGLALQAEFGDYSPSANGDKYFLLEHYMPEGEGTELELETLHKQRSGLDPGRAEEMFISLAMTFTEYGTHYLTSHLVNKEGSTTEMWVGVNSKGVILCYKRDFTISMVRKSHYVFNWPDIKKLSYSKHIFEIVSADSKYKLKLDSNKSLYLFRMAWLHHKFFMKLTNEYTTLQSLAEEFGQKGKELSKSVLHVSPEGKRTELSALRRAASLLSPDRAIFRGKTTAHCGKSNRSESCRETRVSTPQSGHTPLLRGSPINYRTPTMSHDDLTSRGTCARRRVLMGTRAIYTSSHHDVRAASQLEFDPTPSPLPEAYVLNTNIKSDDDKCMTDFYETISESLAEKFSKGEFINDRVITTVRINRGTDGSLGLKVVEGRDGHAYIISTKKGTPAYECGWIHSGDQIQGVDGHNVLNLPYKQVLQKVLKAGDSVELILSQINNGQRTPPISSNAPYANKVTDTTGFDLMSVLQKPIEESYFNAIRYQTATESEENMIITELPRPLSYL
ncbi:tyrosine-protein phosphatase non-receptor type 13-like [Cimex lectularius]|uniref:Uncharacterized protein n=1 Tax=Cimex lectularius TaxID=79782 RepID=A0A8I6SQZ2_CIMLE|nr:tyrosine-protein phosphatase non-receptor type 13-like [Cimex lectularius]